MTFHTDGPSIAEKVEGIFGVKARHMGRDRNGVDCAGAIQMAYACLGRSVPLPTGYPLRWFVEDPGRMRRYIMQTLNWPMANAIEPGDLLLFRVHTQAGDHPGVYLGRGEFLHAWDHQVRRGSMLEVGRWRWTDRLVCAFRPR